MAADPVLTDLTPGQRLRRLELTVTRRLDGLLHGERHGLLPGPGSEPAGSREYRPGEDEVRRMDWSVTARTAVPHVREVDADRELTTWLLVDASPSMEYGTAELDKRELAVAAVATIGFLTAGPGNRLGAQVLTPYGLHRVRPGVGVPTCSAVAGLPDALPDALAEVRRVAHRRGLVVVVSDFLDGLPDDPRCPARWERALRQLTVRHQVLAVEVTDPRELELPDVGLITLVDPETGEHREVWTGDRHLRERYAAAAAAQREQVRDALRRAGATHLALRTDRDWTVDIVRHVHAQRRLVAAAATSHRGGTA
ncbi:DUF58 domain-containing protein [Verrucosispora sioxanthis]|uniref:DUF58 domain-containing protein n=1 Tax=Verrucosispora sioxanthis TaxID=2499994 RepID=UPI0035A09384